jgi:O-antigen ligase
MRLPIRPTALTEAGVLGFVATTPFGPSLPAPVRPLLLVLVMSGLVVARLRGDPVAPPPTLRLVLPMLAFAASFLVSTAFSSHPERSLQRGLFLPLALVLFLAIQDAVVSSAALRRLAAVLVAVLGLLGADAVHQWITGASVLGGRPLYAGRATGSIPHPNDLALVPILLPLALLVRTRPLRPAATVACAGAVALALAAVVLSQSRNAWIGLCVGLAAWVGLTRTSRLGLAAAAGLALLFAGAFVFDVASFRDRVATLASPAREGRIGLYLVAIEMWKEAPFVGQGSFTYGEHYLSMLPHTSLPQRYQPEVAHIPWAHDLFLEALAERGLLGLATFGWACAAIWMALVAAHRSARAAARSVPPAATATATAFAVFLAMGVFDLTFLKDWVLLVFALIAGLAARLPELAHETPPQSR